MDAIRVSALGVTPLSPLRPLPVVPPANPTPPARPAANPAAALVPDLARGLAQSLLQSTVQSALLQPLTGTVQAPAGPEPAFAASLLAALTAPLAATAPTTATDPALVRPDNPLTPSAGTGPIPTPTTPTPALASEASAVGGTFETGASVDFALQTALRFGAGVVAQAAPALQAATLGDGLVRDAMAVLRQGGLQSQGGRPGPEAYARPRTEAERAAATYRPPMTELGIGSLNLLA